MKLYPPIAMMTKQNTYNFLIFFTLVSFGTFGSLSHVFCFVLIISSFVIHIKSNKKNAISSQAMVLFFTLSGCFFLFVLGSLFRNDLGSILNGLSPMFPIPLIGVLVIFHNSANVKLSSKQVSQFSQFSVLFSLLTYILLLVFSGQDTYYDKSLDGGLTLFSGNPIPFSFAMMGVSLFCLADWKNSKTKSKVIAFSCFFIGAYFAGISSGTRGTLLSFIIITPIIIYYLSSRLVLTILLSSILGLTGFLLIYLGTISNLEYAYFGQIKNGLETLVLIDDVEYSTWHRLKMWSAAIKAISNAPLFGYGVTEKVNALKPFLKDTLDTVSHPHNDIFAGIISVGFIGGLAAIVSLFSSLLASLLTPNRSSQKVLFSLMILIPTLITGGVSTVFFNDITSAWLAFSAYLIWATNFKGYEITQTKS